MQNKAPSGFTLIELSIVIVIIGLIVAGVVGGQQLVKQAKLQRIVSELNQYQTAYNTFILAYNAVPGDMSNAQDYWGSSVANGNGNKQINVAGEMVGAWEHLNKASIFPGSYTGAVISGDRDVLGANVPRSDFSSDAGGAGII